MQKSCLCHSHLVQELWVSAICPSYGRVEKIQILGRSEVCHAWKHRTSIKLKACMVVHACNPRTRETEDQKFKVILSSTWIQAQAGLYICNLSMHLESQYLGSKSGDCHKFKDSLVSRASSRKWGLYSTPVSKTGQGSGWWLCECKSAVSICGLRPLWQTSISKNIYITIQYSSKTTVMK